MTTSDTLLLLAGGISLAGLVGYVSWIDLRIAMLKTELLEIYATFKMECKNLSVQSDPAYRAMCEVFDVFIDSANMISFPFIVYIVSVSEEDKTPHVQLTTSNVDLE